MTKQQVHFEDLGKMGYQEAWDYQENLLQTNVRVKSKAYREPLLLSEGSEQTTNHLLFVEHPHVYTLGKSGNIQHVLLNQQQLADKQIHFFHTNRGGDITYHGPGQLVGYPILDLEKFETDIGKYLRGIEEIIIRVLAEYGITGERSPGETGVWIEPSIPGKARKICAIGVRCSRWITMHGFALNVNTDLSYFNYIIPCGISNKQVTSMQKELGSEPDVSEVKGKLIKKFGEVFNAELKIKK
jgi:lipoyl(octanoyl) transferase